MRSRMDKYYKEEEMMQRTSRNDFLYDELYKEKMPDSNVTVLDNINEIDITKIKSMLDSREDYKKLRGYNSIVNNIDNYKNEDINYDFDEVDTSNYDINEILKKKRSDNSYSDNNKIRRISSTDYEFISDLEKEDSNLLSHEKQLRDLYNTISESDGADLFANLKDDGESTEDEEETDTKVEDESENEESFYTSTSKIENADFGEDVKNNSNTTLFIIIAVVAIIVAVLLVIYLKFLK